MRRDRAARIGIVVACWWFVGCGTEPGGGELVATDAYVTPPPAESAPAGGFLTLRNGTQILYELRQVTSPAAERVEIHRSWFEGGVARMAPVDAIEVAAGATVSLEPGGLHLMLFGLEPTAGERIPLRLRFSDGHVLEVAASRRELGDAAMDHTAHDH